VAGGCKANKNGYEAEESVQLIVENAGLQYEKQALFEKAYGPRKGKSDGVVHISKNRKIRVEVKTQNVSGSVSEKMPNMLIHAYNHYEEDEIIFAILGNGWAKGSVDWFKEMCVPANWASYQGHQNGRIPQSWASKKIKVCTELSELKNYITECKNGQLQ